MTLRLPHTAGACPPSPSIPLPPVLPSNVPLSLTLQGSKPQAPPTQDPVTSPSIQPQSTNHPSLTPPPAPTPKSDIQAQPQQYLSQEALERFAGSQACSLVAGADNAVNNTNDTAYSSDSASLCSIPDVTDSELRTRRGESCLALLKCCTDAS